MFLFSAENEKLNWENQIRQRGKSRPELETVDK